MMTRDEWGATCQVVLDASVPGTHFSPFEIADVGRCTYVYWSGYVSSSESPPPEPVLLQAPPIPLLDNALRLIEILEYVREENSSAPVLVNSWYRGEYYNAACGGVPQSMHTTLGAADIVKIGHTPSQVADILEAHPLAEKLGIGRYPSFTHVDIRGWLERPAPARW